MISSRGTHAEWAYPRKFCQHLVMLINSLTLQRRPGDIKCLDSLTEFQEVFNGTAQVNGIEMTGNFTDPEDLRVLFSQADSLQTKYEEAVRRCIERNGDTLKYLGTSATVRDMVAMADALDGPGAPVNYYGISYGTFLGNVFLNSERATCAGSLQVSDSRAVFPERVGRVIIDGVVDPHLWAQKEISLVRLRPPIHILSLTSPLRIAEDVGAVLL